MALRNQIQEIALEFPRYCYRRITVEFQHRDYAVNHKRVLRLMRQDNLLCLKRRFKPVTTDSSHGLPVYPNLLKSTKTTGLNQVWASDITLVQMLHEHIYLAVILDLCSRWCIGRELSRNMGSQLTMNALTRTLIERWTESTTGLIDHSDQGVLYASRDYVNCLKKRNIQITWREREILTAMRLLKASSDLKMGGDLSE